MSPLDPARMLDEMKSWVLIESPTHAPAEVSRLMALVAGQFRAIGFAVRTVPGERGCGDHLLIESPWGGDGPGILVLAHLDTVHPIGTLGSTLPFRIEGDRAYGPGIYDMKGGAFLSLAAARVLAQNGTPTPLPIRWVIAADEEIGSPTSRGLIEAAGDRARHVLVTEPARDGGKCVTARKGTARYTIRFHGRPAHSGTRHADGRSAVKEMARQILALEAMTDYARGVTANVGVVTGGTTVNVVPEHATLLLDLRVPDAAAAAATVALVEGLRPVDPGVRIEIEGGLNRPPYARTPAIAALLAHAQGLAREIGFELVDTGSGGGSDGSFLAHRLPVLDGLGVDGDGAHTRHEHLLVSSLVPRATLLLRLFQTLR
jgi:glutamate carboxypeptidase